MKKTYTFEQPFFNIEVLATGVFCLFLVVVCMVCAVKGLFLPPALLSIFACVAFYQVWNTFVSISNPREVVIEDDAIAFSAFGRTDRYELSDVNEFRVREFPSAGKMYVRINGGGFLRGRYWLQTKVMSEGDELFQRIQDIEYRKHPETIKARARRVNTEYLKNEQAIKEYERAARSGFVKKLTKNRRAHTQPK